MFPGSRIVGLSAVLAAALFTVAATGEPEFSEIVAEEGDVKVTARIRDIDNDNCSYIEKWLLGHYWPDECPRTAIDKLEVVYKGNSVHVPAVSYNDLVNIDKVSVQTGEDSAYSVVVGIVGDKNSDLGLDIVLGFEEMVLLDRVVWNTWQGKRLKQRGMRGITEYFFDVEQKMYVAGTPDKEYTEISTEEDSVKASVIIRERSTGNCSHTPGDACWGDDSLCPRKQVERLIVTFQGKDVYIPVSAYSDLSNVNRMIIKLIADSMYVVYIDGGDAGVSYEAFLHFAGQTLTRRKVWSTIMTTDAMEETEYAYH